MSKPASMDPITPEQAALYREQLEGEGVRIIFVDGDGQNITNHATIRLLLSNLMKVSFLSAVGFSMNAQNKVFRIPGRVGSIITRVREQYSLPITGGRTRVIPETVRVSMTLSKQLQSQVSQYHREIMTVQQQTNTQQPTTNTTP